MADLRGWRCKFGVMVPSTNTIVQPDFDDLRPDGVTNHVSRIEIPNMDLKTDADFDRLVRVSIDGLDGATDRVMTAAPDALIVGMSSLIVWDGLEASQARREALQSRTGVKVTGGSFAMAAALEFFGAHRIAILSPYQPIADQHISQFFADCGFDVVRFHGMRCPSPLLIAHVPPEQVVAAMDEIDGDDIDAIVQFGTNLSMMRQAAEEETRRGKPVLAINSASYWHALREHGIEDRIQGYGRLLAEF